MNDPITIGMVATVATTVIYFLVKKMIDGFERSVSRQGQQLNATVAKFEAQIASIEEKHKEDVKEIQKELNSIKGDFATTFVLREDFFRSMNVVEDNMKSIDSKLDRLLLKQWGDKNG